MVRQPPLPPSGKLLLTYLFSFWTFSARFVHNLLLIKWKFPCTYMNNFQKWFSLNSGWIRLLKSLYSLSFKNLSKNATDPFSRPVHCFSDVGELTIHTLLMYVYDCFLAITTLKLGVRWSRENKAMIRLKWRKQEKYTGQKQKI